MFHLKIKKAKIAYRYLSDSYLVEIFFQIYLLIAYLNLVIIAIKMENLCDKYIWPTRIWVKTQLSQNVKQSIDHDNHCLVKKYDDHIV